MVIESPFLGYPTCLILLICFGGHGTVDGKDNKEEKTREVADIKMYHCGWNFFQLGHDVLW